MRQLKLKDFLRSDVLRSCSTEDREGEIITTSPHRPSRQEYGRSSFFNVHSMGSDDEALTAPSGGALGLKASTSTHPLFSAT